MRAFPVSHLPDGAGEVGGVVADEVAEHEHRRVLALGVRAANLRGHES